MNVFGRLLPVVLLIAAAPVDRLGPVEALGMLDARLARIAFPLITAGAPRCAAQMPGTGLVIHALDQYDAADRAALSRLFPAPVAIAAVVPGSPAELAGLRQGDGIVAVAGAPLDERKLADPPDSARRDAVLARIAALAPGAPFEVVVRRGATNLAFKVHPITACRVQFEVIAEAPLAARSNGQVVQIGRGWLQRLGDEATTVAFAHELAHVVLRHRERLGAHPSRTAGREAERAADLVSLDLLRAAHIDPAIAPRFWRTHGGEVSGGLHLLPLHDPPLRRAAAMEAALRAASGTASAAAADR